jgi:DNA repair photolyase
VPEGKVNAIQQLKEAGVPVHVNIAPIIPGLNDFEIPAIALAPTPLCAWSEGADGLNSS